MRKLSFLIGLLCVLFAGIATAQQLQAGRDYDQINPPQPTETPGKIEVIEFFSYMCPHCAHFDPMLSQWVKALPKDVQFRRMPVIFRPQWEAPARLYFTLESMNELERLHPAAFRAVHEEHADLMTEKGVVDWAARQGLDRKKFTDVFGSFAVQSKVQRAKQAQTAYGIPGVPMLVVAGKYRTPDNFAGDHADLLKLVDALIGKARAEHGKK